jgi:hypothetical protein
MQKAMQGIPVQNKGPLLIVVATLLSSNLHQAVQVLKRLEENKKIRQPPSMSSNRFIYLKD